MAKAKVARTKKSKVEKIKDDVVFEVARLFCDGKKATPISEWLRKLEQLPFKPSREIVYPILVEALRRNFIQLRAPYEIERRDEVAGCYSLPKKNIHVVNARGESALQQVAYAAADLAFEIILRLAAKQPVVHIGLGAGWTTMMFARHLADLLRDETRIGELTLHALSSGFSVEDTHTAPVSFFSFFDGVRPKTSFVGLFAPPFVETGDYDRVIGSPGVRRSFELASEIDIVVTSLARAEDDHGDLKVFLKHGTPGPAGNGPDPGLKALERAGWIGDVQYRPYSKDGPLQQDTGIRAVTIFDLAHLVSLASRQDKHVILLAGPCGVCKETKAAALEPLLRNPRLRVWKHLVLDVATAEELVAMSGGAQGSP